MPERIRVSAIPAFQDNYIWAIHDGRRAAVVDPGTAGPVRQFLGDHGLGLAAILVTHHHEDHIGGIEDLLAATPVPVYGPLREQIDEVTCPVSEPDEIVLTEPGVRFRVLDVPGHTAGHIAYFGHGWLFCGDTLFACGCGRIFEGTPAQLHASLDKLASLPENTQVYCAHEYTLSNLAFAQAVEPHNVELRRRALAAAQTRKAGEPTVPSTIALERLTNPFLRCLIPEVIETVSFRTGTQPANALAVFTALRQWKNTF